MAALALCTRGWAAVHQSNTPQPLYAAYSILQLVLPNQTQHLLLCTSCLLHLLPLQFTSCYEGLLELNHQPGQFRHTLACVCAHTQHLGLPGTVPEAAGAALLTLHANPGSYP